MKRIFIAFFAFLPLFAQTDTEELKKLIEKQNIIIKKLQKRVESLENEKKHQMKAELKAHLHEEEKEKHNIPQISLVLNSSALYRDISNDLYTNYSIPGFIEEGTAEIPFNPDRGFNFNYAEFNLHSEVDGYFDADAIFHISKDSIEIGEAYVTTTNLPYDMSLKGGKFKSGFGYINAYHQHRWNFSYIPLIYEAIFGPEGLNEQGIQFQWNSHSYPLSVGFEALQGKNDRSFGYTSSNSLYTCYMKTHKKFGVFSINGELSLASGKNESGHNTTVYGAHFIAKKSLSERSEILWQNEYLYRNKKNDAQTLKQSGFYTEAVYMYNNEIGGGLRYGAILKNEPDFSENLDRYSAMLVFKPTEFSRLRLQYSKDRSKYIDNERKEIDEIMLELNIITGTHYHQK
ncbi:hypothetical protein [Nitrosophilus alvini]|uniref:hypothetical protein n=1 Tax=Nitrosophilus alvini TaxID=2714855 RepID=UPI0019098AC4|nr:hypothetical protein [Nitrosophilus alvini]